MAAKQRLDLELLARGLVSSRQQDSTSPNVIFGVIEPGMSLTWQDRGPGLVCAMALTLVVKACQTLLEHLTLSGKIITQKTLLWDSRLLKCGR